MVKNKNYISNLNQVHFMFNQTIYHQPQFFAVIDPYPAAHNFRRGQFFYLVKQ